MLVAAKVCLTQHAVELSMLAARSGTENTYVQEVSVPLTSVEELSRNLCNGFFEQRNQYSVKAPLQSHGAHPGMVFLPRQHCKVKGGR